MRILGVDPGSRLTGFGCLDSWGSQLRYVTGGTLKLAAGKSEIPFEDRLLALFEGLSQIIREHQPKVLVVEKVFVAKNAVSALKLGQARGVVILAGKVHGLKIAEYSPTQVKSAVAGYGLADKTQVARMLQLLTGQREFATPDASDGLALAVCHALHSRPSPRSVLSY